jgi:predicted nucleotidyltransferase
MTTKQELLQLIAAHNSDIRRLGVKRFGLFGSFVRDEATPDSDVDVLVEFEEGAKTFKNFSDLADLLEELFNRPVDLLTPEGLSPFIGPKILKEVEDVPFAS